MALIIILNALPGVLKENTGQGLATNMERFEAFDLKITKLTGNHWDRTNPQKLLMQLMNEQGNARHSIEPRIILAFDKSPSSSPEFIERNKALIIRVLVKIAISPYQYTYWLNCYDCWGCIYIFPLGSYIYDPDYYEHPIGLGMREQTKAELERIIIKEVALKSGFRIRPNRNFKEIGKDGEIKIDIAKLAKINPPEEGQLKLWSGVS